MELKRAYQILGVPPWASALSIKRTYRQLAKRWHPDLCATGSSAHSEATQMMGLINEAYSTIQHAPLRYHIETYPLVNQRKQETRPSRPLDGPLHRVQDTLPMTSRLEFWIRFICGAALGVLISFDLILGMRAQFADLGTLLAGVTLLVVLCGIGAARYGDRFWQKIFEYWWLWS